VPKTQVLVVQQVFGAKRTNLHEKYVYPVIAGRPVRAAHPKAGAEASAVISGWRMDQG
jgi:hypothetical protein